MKSFKEYLEDKDLIDGYAPRAWYSQPIQKKIIAYHGGADFKSFTLDHLGSGENNFGFGMNPAMGFGVYFSDCKTIASLYTKYWKGKKAIHKVELNATNIYDLRNGTPHLSTAFDDILKELQKKKEDSPFSTFGVYQGLFKMMDKYKAIEILIKHGIDGAVERLPMGCLEIAVINLKIIKPIDKEMVEA